MYDFMLAINFNKFFKILTQYFIFNLDVKKTLATLRLKNV